MNGQTTPRNPPGTSAGAGRLGKLSCLMGWLLLAGALWLSHRLHTENEQLRQSATAARAKTDALIDFLLFQFRDQLEPLGRTDLLEQPARKALEYLESAQHADDSAVARYRWSVALDNIGSILARTGDLPAAESAFRQALEIAERLAREAPDNPDWQRALAIGLSRLGDLALERGDLTGAQAHQQRALKILDQLAQQAPEDRERQYDVGLAHERLGAVLQAQGDLTEALRQYQTRQIISSSLHTLDPQNPVWQRDLAISYGTIGDVLGATGDSAGALAAYRQFAELAEQLVQQQPQNTEWQRDVAVSQEKLGDLNAGRGDLAAAKAAYQRQAEIGARLVNLDPNSTQNQRDLAASRSRLAAVAERQGKLSDASDLQRQAAEALTALVNKLGTEPARGEAATAWGKLAWFQLLQRRPESALEAARRGVSLASDDPRLALTLAHALLLSGRVADAERVHRQNLKTVIEGGRPWHHAAEDDFKTLRAKGIIHPEMNRIENLLKTGR